MFGKNLSKRFKFKGFKIELKGKRFYLYGITNPKVLLATGEARDLTPKEVKKLKSQGGNKQLIGKKLDDGIVIGPKLANPEDVRLGLQPAKAKSKEVQIAFTSKKGVEVLNKYILKQE